MTDSYSLLLKNLSNLAAVYAIDDPMPLSLPLNEQVRIICSKAKLVNLNPLAFIGNGVTDPSRLVGLSLAELSDSGDEIPALSLTIEEFIQAGYRLENLELEYRSPILPQHYKSSFYGVIENQCLYAIAVIQAEVSSNRQAKLIADQKKNFIDNSASGMFVIDVEPPMSKELSPRQQVQWLAENTKFVDSNEALVNILGVADKSCLAGRSLYEPGIKYDFASMARDFVSQDYSFHEYLMPFVNYKNTKSWLLINVTTQEKNNEICQLFGVVTDTTDRVIQSQEIEYRAKHDGLTGLPNRGYFIEQTEAVLSLAGKNDKHALLMLDLDGFKEVNDTLGHETGDELLKDIGPRLKTVLSNLVSIEARLGGDEFAVFIEDYEDENQLRGLASEIMAAIKSPFAIHGLELSVGGSIGIATYPEMSASISSMMRCADIAMYQAKRQSKDYALYNTDSDHYTVRRLSLMMDVRQAITNNELQLFYQPIMSLENQQVSGFEGLIRWQHPELGMLSPGEFIPLIELTDMIMPVTWWVVETAIKQLADWRKLGWEYSVSVNVSTRNLVDVRFVSFIEDCLAKHNVEGQYLEIEITESTLMADPDKSREVLQSIAALGVNISIDDYGTGYSSLAYLKSLPINTLKIDRAFISQMLLNPQDKIIVNSTIQLAHNLGLKVTAEGIEDLSVISDLKALGCDKGQGFYYCKPISVEKLTVWLASRDSA